MRKAIAFAAGLGLLFWITAASAAAFGIFMLGDNTLFLANDAGDILTNAAGDKLTP